MPWKSETVASWRPGEIWCCKQASGAWKRDDLVWNDPSSWVWLAEDEPFLVLESARESSKVVTRFDRREHNTYLAVRAVSLLSGEAFFYVLNKSFEVVDNGSYLRVA